MNKSEVYKTLFYYSSSPTILIEPDGILSLVNKAFEELSGYKREEIEGKKKWMEFVYKADLPMVMKYWERGKRGDRDLPNEYEFRFIDKCGDIRYVINRARILPETQSLISTLIDITTLKEIETLFNEIFMKASIGLFIVQDGKIKIFNKEFQKRCGYSEDELKGMEPLKLVIPEDRERARQSAISMLKGERDIPYQFRARRKDGNIRWIMEAVVPIIYKGKRAALSTFMDITEIKRMEQELLRMQKMEAIGTLAGGIAHDFNNLLTAILGYIDLSKLYLKDKEQKIKDFLDDATKGCLKAKELVKRFLLFAEGGRPIKKRGSIVKILKEGTELALSGSNIMAYYDIEKDLWELEFDENQLLHVITSVVTNAREAMERGGNLYISARNLSFLGDSETEDLPLKEGNYIHISIRDEGKGIPEEDLSRLFDPYFSTKQRGTQKGMGMGLSICHSIITGHDGYMSIDSELDVGTTVDIYLPAIVSKVKEVKREEKQEMRRKRILVMDDEDLVRELLKEMLKNMGYEVVTASNGKEAVDIFKEEIELGRPIDAFILDLTVKGGMSGKESLKEILKIDPDVKAILSTGYLDDPAIKNYRELGFSGALLKPFKMKDLNSLLKDLLKD